jgi:hypothetical protein
MAVILILVAMTHQGDVSLTSHLLDQSQSELLAMILDPFVGLIEYTAAVKELTSVPAPEIGPGDLAGSKYRK